MNVHESLVIAQETARDLLVVQMDMKRGIPVRAKDHTDLWPGDQWPEAYLAAEQPELADMSLGAIARSVRPDGSYPQLMQGSHIRAGIETRWIDRQVYRQQGNGALHLDNGEWVTKSYGPPTQASSAVTMLRAGRTVPNTMGPTDLLRASEALTEARGNSDGLIASRKIDELTRSTAELAGILKKTGPVIDPAINASMVLNDIDIKGAYELEAITLPGDVEAAMDQRADALDALLDQSIEDKSLVPEHILAMARVWNVEMLSEAMLSSFFAAPDSADKHPEDHYLTMAETIEVARITSHWSEAAQDYLSRILPVFADMGALAMTRYEGIGPSRNAVANKYNRKQLWLPTAAQIVQIQPSLIN